MTIEELLRTLEVPFLTSGHHHCRPGWLQLDCPFCGSDSQKYHLGFNLRSQHFNCWKCGRHGIYPVLEALGLSRRAVKEFLEDQEISGDLPKEKVRRGLVEPSHRGPLLKQHKDYLTSRGYDPEEIQRLWKIEGIAIAPALSWRIYIPVIYRDQRVSWTARAIGDAMQRYLSASAEEEAMNIKHLVYGIDYCQHSIVVVEGPTDTWAVGPGAGGLFGTAFSTAQVNKLRRFPLRVVCFDSSADAQARAEELCGQLSCFPGQTLNVCLDAKDPGSASAAELQKLRKIARI